MFAIRIQQARCCGLKRALSTGNDKGMTKPDLYKSAQETQRRDNVRVLEFYRYALDRRPAKIYGNAQALDIGCGNGSTTFELLKPVIVDEIGCKRLIGTDVSPSMIDFAKQSYNHPAVEFDVFDVSSKESAEAVVKRYGHFEYVFSFYALHWVRDLSSALANVRHVMRPKESECLFSFLALNPALLVYRRLLDNPKWGTYVRNTKIPFAEIYDANTLKKIIDDSGFLPQSCEVLDMTTKFSSRQALKDASVAVCPVHKSIPPELIPEYENDLAESYIEINDGRETISYKLAVIHASYGV